MATYTLTEAPEVTVSVRGKDSPTTRQKAIEKIAEMMELGELPNELLNGLSAEQLILTEAPAQMTDSQGDEEKEPLVMAVQELSKFFPLKIKTQRLKQAALQARHNLDVLFTDETIEQDLDQLEEVLKANFKTLKEFASSLGEYRQAKQGADKALIILDEALQFNLSTLSISNSNANLSAEVEASEPNTEVTGVETELSEVEADVAEAEATTETAKNGNKKRPYPKGRS